jgi:hypothetical protein
MTGGRDRRNHLSLAVIARSALRFFVEGLACLGLCAMPATPELLYCLTRRPLAAPPPAVRQPETHAVLLSSAEREVWADLVRRLG